MMKVDVAMFKVKMYSLDHENVYLIPVAIKILQGKMAWLVLHGKNLQALRTIINVQ